MESGCRLAPWLGMLWLIATAPAALALEVKVDSRAGVPRIVVDGKPVMARMFWGAPGGMSVRSRPEGQPVAFEFVPAISVEDGTLHFRFGETPGEVILDDIRIVDEQTGRDVLATFDCETGEAAFARSWRIWPPGAQNTVGAAAVAPTTGSNASAGLRITLKPPTAGGRWPDFHLYTPSTLKIERGHRHRVSFWTRSTPPRDLRVAVYRPGETYEQIGSPGDVFTAQIKLAATAGVDFVSFPMGLPWPAPGKPVDFKGADAACERVLAANPRALLLPRVGMGAPAWWRAAHPDEVMRFEDGSQARHPDVVPGEVYLRDATARLAELIKHLEAKFGDRIAGYHPCGQNTGEWFYQDTWGRLLNGYSPADQREWRKWLRARYASDHALRKAWNRADATIDTATVPAAKIRHASSGVLRDPATERELIDFARFQQELMADCVTTLARTVRQTTDGKKLVVFFYGYVFEFGAVGTGAPVSGHYALRRALNSPDIDVLCSPISYFDRGVGQSAPAMTAAESVALAGKMWLAEDDTSTYLSTGTPPGSRERVKTLEESNHLLARNVAHECFRNFGMWWMDLGSSGWFNDPGMWAMLNKLAPMGQAMIDNPVPFSPEVAAVIDEASMLHVAPNATPMSLSAIYEVRRPLGRMGAPCGQYLLDDVLAGKVKAKLYVMLNAWRLTAAQRQALKAATRGASVIWCYAPGYFDGDSASFQAMSELTGFAIQKTTATTALATPTAAGHAAGITAPFGRNNTIRPLFAASDAKAGEILATFPDGSPAVALRNHNDGVSIFVAAPGVTSELLRLAARQAGVHLYARTDVNVYANGRFIAIHAPEDGPVELNLRRSGEVWDVLAAKAIGRGPKLVVPVKKGQTVIMELR